MVLEIETENAELVQILTGIGASVDNMLQPFGYTPLQKALLCDKPEVASCLLGLGADANKEVSKVTADKSRGELPQGMLSPFLDGLSCLLSFLYCQYIPR